MKTLASPVLCFCLIAGISAPASAVMFLDTGDITHNTTTPGDNSGWQYEGDFNTELGVPIAPLYFIGAAHLTANAVGDVFIFHGESYTTVEVEPSVPYKDIPGTDLRIWKVDHAFPTYAPLSSGAADIGATVTMIGRGTRRGNDYLLGATLKGWSNGPTDNVRRWGRNVVEGVLDFSPFYGEVLYCDFNNPGIAEECHLSTGDSGGGMWVFENGLWRLAGINLAVDGPFREPPSGTPNGNALFDAGGLEYESSPGVWTLVPDGPADVPSSFYCSRISASLSQILAITGGDNSLAPESFSAWQKLYFTPAQIADTATTGPLADFDADGISNLLEFALNLDPTCNVRTTMTEATGFSGLPLVKLETISGADHLTVEFVRRTGGSGAGLTCTPQFSSDLGDWQAAPAETVVAINPRWERVKVVDPQTTTSEVRRVARVKVSLAD